MYVVVVVVLINTAFMFSLSVHVTEETGTIELTFDLPQSPMLERNTVLLLALENPPKGENLDATFSSQSLQPNTQVTNRSLATVMEFFICFDQCCH